MMLILPLRAAMCRALLDRALSTRPDRSTEKFEPSVVDEAGV